MRPPLYCASPEVRAKLPYLVEPVVDQGLGQDGQGRRLFACLAQGRQEADHLERLCPAPCRSANSPALAFVESPQPVVPGHLEKAQRLQIDSSGNSRISLWGPAPSSPSSSLSIRTRGTVGSLSKMSRMYLLVPGIPWSALGPMIFSISENAVSVLGSMRTIVAILGNVSLPFRERLVDQIPVFMVCELWRGRRILTLVLRSVVSRRQFDLRLRKPVELAFSRYAHRAGSHRRESLSPLTRSEKSASSIPGGRNASGLSMKSGTSAGAIVLPRSCRPASTVRCSGRRIALIRSRPAPLRDDRRPLVLFDQ